MTQPSDRIRIAEHIWVRWNEVELVQASCPNCGSSGPARKLLDIEYVPPGSEHRFNLRICSFCTARFVDNQETMDYSTEELIEIGWHVYQIQLGAGVWPITSPLTKIAKPPGSKMLEIGGAYGFGLDFGIRALGWQGEGFDPSPLAAFGARELGLQVSQDYFEQKDIVRGPFDIVVATEVVEHLPSPCAFFELIRKAVREDGILLITTPNAEYIAPDVSPDRLLPLLSPGAHVVLQTATSLEHVLRMAGFAHVEVRRDAMSLVAYASPSPIVQKYDPVASRRAYRQYLIERSDPVGDNIDLMLGFAGRGYFEAVNDGDYVAAQTAWTILLRIVEKHFGLELESIASLPSGAAEASLAELHRVMPLGLGMILFARAMHLLGQNRSRSNLLPILRLAISAIDALQGSLKRRSLTDGLSVSIREAAEVEIFLCLADSTDSSAVRDLVAFVQKDPAQITLAWRGFVGLVNAGAFSMARELSARLNLEDLIATTPGMVGQDARLAQISLDLQTGLTEAAKQKTALFEKAGGDPDKVSALYLDGFVRLVNEEKLSLARGLLPMVEPLIIKFSPPYDETSRNALFAAGILFLQDKEQLLRSVTLFARVRNSLVKLATVDSKPHILFWPTLRGEVIALRRLDRAEEAMVLLQTFLPNYQGAPEDLLAMLGDHK